MRASASIDKRPLKAAAYYHGAAFGSFDIFNLDDETLGQGTGDLASNPWRRDLIQRELDRLEQLSTSPVLARELASFYAPQGVQNRFVALLDRTRDLLGFDDEPSLHLVDSLPSSVASRDWDAMSVDRKDEKYFRAPAGIYFKKTLLTHCYFEYVISHELIHWAISQKSVDYFPHTSAYEEGLCDLLSLYVLLGQNLLPLEALVNLIVYNRVLQPHDKPWHTYWKFCKAWLAAAAKGGIQETIRTGKAGRGLVAAGIPLSALSINDDPLLWQMMSIAFEAEGAMAIDIDDYIVLEATLRKREPGKTSINDLCDFLKLPHGTIVAAADRLARLNLLSQEDSDILYQANSQMPSNIKFSLR